MAQPQKIRDISAAFAPARETDLMSVRRAATLDPREIDALVWLPNKLALAEQRTEMALKHVEDNAVEDAISKIKEALPALLEVKRDAEHFGEKDFLTRAKEYIAKIKDLLMERLGFHPEAQLLLEHV